MEDNRTGHKELLVAKSNKGCGRYVEECDMCQKMKNRTEEVVGKLKLSGVPERP